MTSRDPKSLYSVAWFEAAFDALEELVLIKGPASQLHWANRPMREMYGLDNEALALDALAAVRSVDVEEANPDDTLQYVRDDYQVFSTGEPLEVTEPITTREGAIRYLATRKTALRTPAGEVVGTVGISRLLDGELSAEQQAREDRHRDLQGLRTLVDTLPVAVVMVDAHRHVIASSRLWKETFGEDRGQGQPLVGPEPFDVPRLAKRAMEEGAPQRVEDCRWGRMHFDLHVSPWRLNDGRLGGVVVLAIDVSAVRRRERELSALNEELAQLTYRASHDLIAPLRTSLGWIQMIREDLADGELDEAMKGVTHAETSLIKLSERVRELSDLALADVSEQAFETVQLSALVDRVFESVADRAGVVLENAVDPELSLHVPEKRVRAVLSRLVDNGIRFSDPKADPSWVRVETAGTPPVIRVVDNGIGMPDDGVDVFGLFVRGVAGYGGHGLGLHVARKHVDRMDGTLSVDRGAQQTTLMIELSETVWR